MAQGRRVEWRQMLVNQGWVIEAMFRETGASAEEYQRFVAFGAPGPPAEAAKDVKSLAVNEKVGEYFRTGVFTVD